MGSRRSAGLGGVVVVGGVERREGGAATAGTGCQVVLAAGVRDRVAGEHHRLVARERREGAGATAARRAAGPAPPLESTMRDRSGRAPVAVPRPRRGPGRSARCRRSVTRRTRGLGAPGESPWPRRSGAQPCPRPRARDASGSHTRPWNPVAWAKSVAGAPRPRGRGRRSRCRRSRSRGAWGPCWQPTPRTAQFIPPRPPSHGNRLGRLPYDGRDGDGEIPASRRALGLVGRLRFRPAEHALGHERCARSAARSP